MTQDTFDFDWEPSIQARFEQFHEDNPIVYETLVRLARQAKASGSECGAIGTLWEVMRWHLFVDTTDENSEFKLNNNYRSRYARLIMEKEPDLEGFFELRELKTA